MRDVALLVLAVSLVTVPARAEELTYVVVPAAAWDRSTRDQVELTLRRRGLEVVRAPLEPTRADAVATVGRATQEARELFLAGRYQEAIRSLAATESTHLAALLESADGRPALVTLNLWLGALHLAAENPADARRRFSLAQRLDPSARLDESFWPPAYIEAFEDARQAPPAKASFVVTSKPASVRIRWNGTAQRIGTPFETQEGLHYLLAEQLGFDPVARVIEVRAGVLESLDLAPAAPRDRVPIAAAMRWYAELPSAAAAAVSNTAGADRVVVVSGARLALHDRKGRLLSSAAGNSVSDAALALFPADRNVTEEASLFRRWWFWTAVGVGVAGIVGGTVWATRDTDLRGTFVVGGSM